MSTALVWFRRDLRLIDNPALDAALREHDAVIPVYIHAPHEEAPWEPGAASRWWLHHSLHSLDVDLRARGSALHVRAGNSLDVLRALIADTGAAAVYWNRLYEPPIVRRDARIKSSLRDAGIVANSYKACVLFEPWELATGQNQPYRVFTPYWKNARSKLTVRPPLPAPAEICSPVLESSLALDALSLLPAIRWDLGLPERWTPGEHSAQQNFADFLDVPMADYARDRDRPDRHGTSGLSPHLHFGEISVMQIAWELEMVQQGSRRSTLAEGAASFLRELGWREFSQHLLYHFPQMPEKNLNPRFDTFTWGADDAAALDRWQRGRTGIPIIDAGMRELWNTGAMHNRVRMLVASFLTKNLRQHWRHGALWFWDTLVDADLANNSQGWQWTAGCGVDASPYFRIFNPVTQGERFDPQGHYVKRWVHELGAFSAKTVHQPWTVPDLLRRSGYPLPMVDLSRSRVDALAAYQQEVQSSRKG
jgi:deoxyribodipyrimidine photo-lyase